MHIKERTINPEVYDTCINNGYPEIVARIIAGRTDTFNKDIFEFSLDAIKPADNMADCTKASRRLALAINSNETILLFTDYDVDGCTSMAVLYEALHDVFGVPASKIIRLTGHRTRDGYGLTDSIADKIIDIKPDIVITADTGTSDGERITRVADAGVDVIITDHHLIPKEGIPKSALAVVNPQRENCQYDSSIAGCGVAWLLMTALSREMGAVLEQKQKIHQLLDYVALGTVADLVSMASVTNRYFVKKGLEFINRRARTCWQVALKSQLANSGYIGFQLAPRINASSRMTGEALLALEFLTENDHKQIAVAYDQLDMLNNERQKIEKEMFEAAKASMGIIDLASGAIDPILIYYNENNHPGIQGIVAGKITENFGIPAIMLANIGNNIVVGSGRAGQFLHIRDALQTFDNLYPGVFIAYGGHKAAAGFKINMENVDLFKKEFQDIVTKQLADQDTTPYIKTDGSLKLKGGISLETYYHIEALNPFGMGFPSPMFHDQMVATDVRVMGKYPVHISMMLDGIKSVFFNALAHPEALMPVNSGDLVNVVYTLNLNSWQGRESLQLFIKKIDVCCSKACCP
ncbi:MAG: single-stranded-DNA-specific exonuclease RecJ [Desulfamplus sp.]|nr:single-stranded-DNA-specific exonuclease RecJ [Desulfamplus sp.]